MLRAEPIKIRDVLMSPDPVSLTKDYRLARAQRVEITKDNTPTSTSSVGP